MIVGNTALKAAATPVEYAADRKRVGRFLMPLDGYIAKLSFMADGLGSGVGDQVHMPVIYSAAGVLLGVGAETTVKDGQAAGWVDFVFPSPVPVVAGVEIDFGLLSGPATNTTRVWELAADGSGGRWNADTYSGGAATPFGTSTAIAGRAIGFATHTIGWQVPANVDDFYNARLPFADSQDIFKNGSFAPSPIYNVDCGWYGQDLDDELGAFAIVQEGGKYEGLLGERVQIRRRDQADKQVFAFVHDRYPLLEPIAVTRRLYLALGYLAADSFPVTIRVMTSGS